jgi:hypothetical protein
MGESFEPFAQISEHDDGDGIPPDVLVWLAETYTERGVEIWKRAYRDANAARRKHMIRMARTPDGGS